MYVVDCAVQLDVKLYLTVETAGREFLALALSRLVFLVYKKRKCSLVENGGNICAV